jgi:SAM-dependent methyltransferase
VTKVSALTGHRIWAPHYDDGPNPVLALESRVLRPVLDRCAAKRVIDVGCGTGRWMRYFVHRQTSVFGVDICPEMLRQAMGDACLRTRLALGDVLHLPFAGASASLILCSFALGYIANLTAMFAEIGRIAEPCATVVVSDLHPDAVSAGWTRSCKVDGRSYDIEHHAHSDAEILRAALSAGLTLERKMHACLGPPEFPILERAGKSASFESLSKVRAVWTAVWKKPC